jgi:hypothetical protein
MTNAINTTKQLCPVINWSERVMPSKSLAVPTEEEISQLFTEEQAIKRGFTNHFYGKMVIFYCRRIIMRYCKEHKLNFKGHCREMEKLLQELERAMIHSVSIETDRWLSDIHYEYIQLHKFGIIWQLKLTIMNDILKMNPDCEERDVAYGINAALLIIQEMDDHGDLITAEANQMLGVTHLTYTRAQVLTLVKVLLLDMAETLNCKAEWSAPTKTGIKAITNKYMELLKSKWKK